MKTKVVLVLLILIHSYLLLNLNFFPYPELFLFPYLTTHGLIPYQQIIDQHAPGLLFLPINFQTLGLTSPQIARFWLIGIIAVNQLLIFFIGHKIFQLKKKAILASVIYLIWQPFLGGGTLWIDSFLPLFYLPSFILIYYFLTTKSSARYYLIISGLLFSLALLFKQTALPLFLLTALLIFWRTRKWQNIIDLLTGFLPLPLICLVYFSNQGTLTDLWYWTIWFNLVVYARSANLAPTFSGLIRVLIIFIPVFFLLRLPNKLLAVMLVIFLLGSLAGSFNRFDLFYFQTALPFVCLITAWGIINYWLYPWIKFSLGIYLGIMFFWLNNFYPGHLTNKILLFDPPTYQLADKIKSYKQKKVFLFGVSPHLYFLSQTLPSGSLFVFQLPWYLQSEDSRVAADLIKHPPKLVIVSLDAMVDNKKISDYAPRIGQFIRDNYQIVENFQGTLFMQRNDD